MVKKKQSAKKKLIWIAIAAALVLMICGIVIWVGSPSADETPKASGKYYVQMEIADFGTITAELDADAAPITVANFVNLVDSGFLTV